MTSIAYLAHDLSDAAVARRTAMMRASGADVALAGFHRKTLPPEQVAGVAPLALGPTHDARLTARAASVGRVSLLGMDRLRRYFQGAEAVLARNLEMLVIAGRLVETLSPRPRLVYECLDIHRLMSDPGILGMLLRWIERRAGARVDAVLTSSPAFVRHHFAATPLADRVHLIENRVFLGSDGALGPVPPRRAGPPWRIGWFGALRCRRSFELLAALALQQEGAVEVVIRGRASPAVFASIEAEAAAAPWVRFEGPYRWPEDLSRCYAEVHFSWCIDFYEAGANSAWLLPNRLYEGCLYGAVPIALSGVEAGRWLTRRHLGEMVEEPVGPSLERLFAAMSPARYSAAAERIVAAPRSLWYADEQDCSDLLAFLTGRQGATARSPVEYRA